MHETCVGDNTVIGCQNSIFKNMIKYTRAIKVVYTFELVNYHLLQ